MENILFPGDEGIQTVGMQEIQNVDAKIHLRIIQRSGRKTLTIIEGLEHFIDDLKKTTKYFRKSFCCTGSIDSENVVKLTGDHRNDVRNWLVEKNYANEDQIVVHGY